MEHYGDGNHEFDKETVHSGGFVVFSIPTETCPEKSENNLLKKRILSI